jgi:hypothetical protein
MKNRIIWVIGTFFLIIILAICCGREVTILPSAEVNFLSEGDGTITMRAIGTGNNQEEAIADAEKNAFDVILFRGLPESKQKMALIGTDEKEQKTAFKEYFSDLYGNSRYKTFVMSSIPTSDLIKQPDGKKNIAVDVKINFNALRTDLEQHNIIRKFGL